MKAILSVLFVVLSCIAADAQPPKLNSYPAANAVIFLDFDGVLFDTVKEAFSIVMLAQKKSNNLKKIDFNAEEFILFRKYRYLITSAGTYYFLMRAIEEFFKKGSAVEQSFFFYREHIPEAEWREFEHKFFHARDILKSSEYENWLLLNTPYPFLDDFREIVAGHGEFCYIITTKDTETVLRLLEVFHAELSEERIIGRDLYKHYGSKDKIIEALMGENGVSRALFIDDSSQHLDACRRISGLDLLQPDWGYLRPDDQGSSREEISEKIKFLLRG